MASVGSVSRVNFEKNRNVNFGMKVAVQPDVIKMISGNTNLTKALDIFERQLAHPSLGDGLVIITPKTGKTVETSLGRQAENVAITLKTKVKGRQHQGDSGFYLNPSESSENVLAALGRTLNTIFGEFAATVSR